MNRPVHIAGDPLDEQDAVTPDGVLVKALRESPRRPGRYLLSLSDGRELVVGIAALADHGATRTGVALSSTALQQLTVEHSITELVDRGLGYLARGRRTRRELETRFRQKAAEPKHIVVALERLKALGVLSDEAVAEAEAASRLRRGEAPARVRQQLRRKGVAGPVVTDALASAIRQDDFDERAACYTVAEKRARTLRAQEPAVARRKLLGFLLRRGYNGTIARAVARELLPG
jgi:regulatory protein